MAPSILFEDNHLIAINKAPGELVQGDRTGDTPLVDQVAAFIKKRDHKPGNVFLGVVHRLDRPTSGVVLFAKTSKALSRLNELFRRREVEKRYWAIVDSPPPDRDGVLRHDLVRDRANNRSRAVRGGSRDAKAASLRYRWLASNDRNQLLEVTPETGRHHQIRVQLAAVGCPIRGDLKYGAATPNPDGSIDLHARSLALVHPVRREPIRIEAPPPDTPLWRVFLEAAGWNDERPAD